ncbi:MAG: AAA family ATPase [Marinifilaceae bacterium]
MIFNDFPCKETLYLTTSAGRFFAQESVRAYQKQNIQVSDNIINPLNTILSKTKFSKLKCRQMQAMKGRETKYNRKNKLYLIKDNNEYYTEHNFSLGERLILNALDFIENINESSLLLINELELALHPIAQIKLYDYLEQIAKEKKLTVILSTHSSSLIKHAKKMFYLEKGNDGVVTIMDNCYSSYILKEIATNYETVPDYIFFVEDIMACRYLNEIIKHYQVSQTNRSIIKILPVGGWRQVVLLMDYYKTLPFPIRKMHVFLDKDVEETIKKFGNPNSESDKKIIKLFHDYKHNINYLSITPELGIWKWLLVNNILLEEELRKKYGNFTIRIVDMVAQINDKQPLHSSDKDRDVAKKCFKSLASRIKDNFVDIEEDEFYKLLISIYVENRLKDQQFQNKVNEVLGKIMNRYKQ